MPLSSHSSSVEVCPACDAEWRTGADRYRQVLERLVECVEEDDRFSAKTSNALTAAREALRTPQSEATPYGYAHKDDGSACMEPVWCPRPHFRTPKVQR